MAEVLRTVEGLDEGTPGSPAIENLRASCNFITRAIEKRLLASPEALAKGEGRVLILGTQRSRTISGTILRRLGYEVVEAEMAAPLPFEDGRDYDIILLDLEAGHRVEQARSRWPTARVILIGSVEQISMAGDIGEAWILPCPFSYLSLASIVKEALTEAA